MIRGSPSQILGLECVCCTQVYYPTKTFADQLEAELLGTDDYVVCPICGANVPEDVRDDAYKKRWHLAMKGYLRRPELRLLIALSLLTRVKSTTVTDKVFDLVLRRLNTHYPDKTLWELKAAGDELCEFLKKRKP